MWCHCILPPVSLVRGRNWGSYQIACMAYPRPNGWCPYVRNCPVPEVSWTGDFLLLFGSLSVLLYGSPADPTCYTHGIGKKKTCCKMLVFQLSLSRTFRDEMIGLSLRTTLFSRFSLPLIWATCRVLTNHHYHHPAHVAGMRRGPFLLASTTIWVASCASLHVHLYSPGGVKNFGCLSQAISSVCLVHFAFFKRIFNIWSTKYRLIAKLITDLVCKLRDESNEPN